MTLIEKTLRFEGDEGIDIVLHTDGLVEIIASPGKDGRLLQISKESFDKLVIDRLQFIATSPLS